MFLNMEETVIINCPYCNSETLVILDGVNGDLNTVSDCENCCRPINVNVRIEDGIVNSVQAEYC